MSHALLQTLLRVQSLTFGRVEQPRFVINRGGLCFIVTRVGQCCCSKCLTIRVPADCGQLAATEASLDDDVQQHLGTLSPIRGFEQRDRDFQMRVGSSQSFCNCIGSAHISGYIKVT